MKLFRFYPERLGDAFCVHLSQEEIELLLHFKQSNQAQADLSNGGLSEAVRLSRDIETLLLTLQDHPMLKESEEKEEPAARKISGKKVAGKAPARKTPRK